MPRASGKGWGRHVAVVTGADDPSKQVSKDEWNDDLVRVGFFGYEATNPTTAILTGALVPTDSKVTVAAETGTVDDLDSITNTNTLEGDELILYARTGDTITVRHNFGGANIFLIGAVNKIIDQKKPMALLRIGTDWYEYVSPESIDRVSTSTLLRKKFADPTDPTKIVDLSLSGIATAVAVTLLFANPLASTLTFPNATSQLATLALVEVLSNKTLTRPRFVDTGSIDDDSGNEYLRFLKVASAVNEISVKNNATGLDPEIQATGGDANVGILFVPKGTGVIKGTIETMLITITDESTPPTVGVKYTIYAPFALKIVGVTYAIVTVAPVTSAFIMDVLKAGTTIYSTKPQVAAAANTGSSSVLTTNPTSFAQGDKIEFKVDTLDSGAAAKGAKLVLQFYRT